MFYSPLTKTDKNTLLKKLNISGIDALFNDIQSQNAALSLPESVSELEMKSIGQMLSEKNKTNFLSFLGGGVYDHFIPAIIQHICGRSEFYTAYTPYQPELSQGTLKCIFEYQTMISNLMGLDISNASLYDGASALGEGCIIASNSTKRNTIVCPSTCNPNHIEVLKTYLESKNITLKILDFEPYYQFNSQKMIDTLSDEIAGIILPYPDFFGTIINYSDVITKAKENDVTVIFSCDPIAMGLLKNPGECGADIAVAEGQALGSPQSFGGPLLGIIAIKEKYLRLMPGRIVGQTTDKNGKTGYALTFQTREQHIRREKALSNICSNQALVALAATVYLAYCGPKGLKSIAQHCYKNTRYLKTQIEKESDYQILNKNPTFKEFLIKTPIPAKTLLKELKQKNIAGGLLMTPHFNDDHALLIAVTETKTKAELDQFIGALKSIECKKVPQHA